MPDHARRPRGDGRRLRGCRGGRRQRAVGIRARASRIASRSEHDLLRFSLHPFDVERLGTAAGLVLLHAAVVWAAAAIIRAARDRSGACRVNRSHARSPCSRWLAGAAVVVAAARILGRRRCRPARWHSRSRPPPSPPLVLSRPRGAARRASQAARLGLFFAGLTLPALSLYPSLHADAVASKEQLVSGSSRLKSRTSARTSSRGSCRWRSRRSMRRRRSPSSLRAPPKMPRRRPIARSWCGRRPSSRPHVRRRRSSCTARTGVWSAGSRSTCPEYGATAYRGGSCTDWELFEEVSPFGSIAAQRPPRQPQRLRATTGASAGLSSARCSTTARCRSSRPRARISSRCAGASVATRRPPSGSDVEFAIYGWSRAPLYASGTASGRSTTPCSPGCPPRATPIWVSLTRDGAPFRVYFFNDRGGIYALGYPRDDRVRPPREPRRAGHPGRRAVRGPAPRRHPVRCGHVAAARERPGASARGAIELLPEAVPRLRRGRRRYPWWCSPSPRAPISPTSSGPASRRRPSRRRPSHSGWSRTTRRCSSAANDRSIVIDDEFMVLVRRAIDEDVNLFDGARLQATSERDLFASRLLPARTPADVYRAIVLDRLPTTFVVEEVGGRPVPARRRTGARGRHARGSSPSRRRCGSARSRRRSTSSIGASCLRPCCSCCSGRRSATGWPSGSRIR